MWLSQRRKLSIDGIILLVNLQKNSNNVIMKIDFKAPATKSATRKRGAAAAAAEAKETPKKEPQSKRAIAAKTESEEEPIPQEIPDPSTIIKTIFKITKKNNLNSK